MPTVYPGALDSFVNPTDTDTLDTPPHDGQHTDSNDAMEAVQAELGLNPRGAFATVRARLDDLGVWKDWAPAYVNLTVGNGTVVARYTQIGELVVCHFSFTLGSTSLVATGPTVSLPVAAAAWYISGQTMGEGWIDDATGADFIAIARKSSTTVVLLMVKTSGAAYVGRASITSTVPMTWATGDVLAFTAVYESV